MARIRTVLACLGVFYLGACATPAPTPSVAPERDRMIPVPVDAKTGYLPTRVTSNPDEVRVLKADVLVREKSSVKPSSQLMVVEGDDYFVEQSQLLERFAEVISVAQLQQRIAERGIADKVGNLATRESVKRAYLLYGPFLLMRASVVSAKNARRPFMSMEVLDPGAEFEQLFAARTMTSLLGSGSDQRVRRPLFNSLIDWINISERYAGKGGSGEGRFDEQ